MNVCILIGTFRPDVAREVMTKFVPKIIESRMFDLQDLADELLTKNIISARQKRKATDENTRRPGDERMKELLDIVTASVGVINVESVFKKFLEILLKQGTETAKYFHKCMESMYKHLSDD